jgi:hypothetical protein
MLESGNAGPPEHRNTGMPERRNPGTPEGGMRKERPDGRKDVREEAGRPKGKERRHT